MVFAAALAADHPRWRGRALNVCLLTGASRDPPSWSITLPHALLRFSSSARDELPNAVALNSGLFNGTRVLGPALGGLVIAVAGPGACFLLNAVSFVAVLASLRLIRPEELVPLDRGRRAPDARCAGARRRSRSFAAFRWPECCSQPSCS